MVIHGGGGGSMVFCGYLWLSMGEGVHGFLWLFMVIHGGGVPWLYVIFMVICGFHCCVVFCGYPWLVIHSFLWLFMVIRGGGGFHGYI